MKRKKKRPAIKCKDLVRKLDPAASGRVSGGAVAPLAAILVAPTVNQVATAVDLGTVASPGTQLQTAADAAAPAGARRLSDRR